MVRPAEKANVTNPAAERRFDAKTIYAFIGIAVLLLLVFLFIGNRLFSYEEGVNPQPKSSPSQLDGKRGAP